MLLSAAERRIGMADRLPRLIADLRNPLFVTHSVADILMPPNEASEIPMGNVKRR